MAPPPLTTAEPWLLPEEPPLGAAFFMGDAHPNRDTWDVAVRAHRPCHDDSPSLVAGKSGPALRLRRRQSPVMDPTFSLEKRAQALPRP